MNVSPVLYHNSCRFCTADEWATKAHIDGWICPRCLPIYRAGVEATRDAMNKYDFPAQLVVSASEIAARLLEEEKE